MNNNNRLYVFDQEYCVICGAPIPEGRQVCINCENAIYTSEPNPHSRPITSATDKKIPDER